VPAVEAAAAAKTRAGKRAWLAERGYRIVEVPAAEVEKDMVETLARIDAAIA
jgi:tRNA/rRNA methyltransferase